MVFSYSVLDGLSNSLARHVLAAKAPTQLTEIFEFNFGCG